MLDQILLMIFFLSTLLLVLDAVFIAKKRTRKAPAIVVTEYLFLVSGVMYGICAYNFEYVLTFATLISGMLYFLDYTLFSRLRRARYAALLTQRPTLNLEEREYLQHGLPVLIDYARSFFWVLFLVFILRSFFFEPFRIPSGSLEPTLLTGDFILVNKFAYGLRLPVLNQKVVSIHMPQRGDIVVFAFPVNPKIDFIKRVVGVPGDRISYINKVFYINGQVATQMYQDTVPYVHQSGNEVDAYKLQENLLGVKHEIYQFPSRLAENFTDLMVPEGMYFMIGDNRDDSDDSRYWGFVPEKYIVGKPLYVIFSWEKRNFTVRWQRSGLHVQALREPARISTA